MGYSLYSVVTIFLLMISLNTSLRSAISTTSTYINLLKELNVSTIEDLLHYYPRAHEDQSEVKGVADLEVGQVHTVQGVLQNIKNVRTKNNKFLTKADFIDQEGTHMEVVWFNQRYLKNVLQENKEMLLTGKILYNFGKFTIQSPAHEIVKEEQIHTGRIVPIYREHDKISTKWLREKIALVIHYADQIEENLPQEILEKEKFISRSEAIRKIHFPESMEDIEEAKKRLAFEELFFIQLRTLEQKKMWHETNGDFTRSFSLDVDVIKIFLESLPFTLTEAQRIVLYEILRDFEKDYPMMRLLEGDVGSGKTVVVLAAMMNVYKHGFQCVLMAPTEVLARQHFATVQKLVEAFTQHPSYSKIMENRVRQEPKEEAPIDLFSEFMDQKVPQVALLTGSVKGKERDEVLLGMQSGSIDIVIGTHALIQENIAFANLGFAVIDEQHKFGVEQRQRLKEHGDPHILNMSATPIPRSLALTAYGDQDLSVINQMPPGRQEIHTKIVPPKNRNQVYHFISDQVKEGRQVYVICPLIDESDVLEVKAAVAEQKFLQEEIFPQLTVDLLHGKLSPAEKTTIMNRFKDKESHILVSTSVIEVGIDVPNATIMLIEGAERFGLAQLHQFRGRVGRGEHKSHCFLFTDSNSQQSMERLRAMEQCKDGFKLAEIDMQLRGPGEVYGIRQSGIPDLKMARLNDAEMIVRVRECAENFIEKAKKLIEK